MSDSNNASSGGGSLASTATLALVSTYIAEERPEGDRLGYWAEIAQAFSIGAMVLAAVLFIIMGLLLIAGVDR